MEIKAQTSGWQFIQEPEARWLAVEALLIATRFNLSFGTIYLGAIGEALVDWQKKHYPMTSLLAKAGYQGMTIALDGARMEYLAAKRDWSDVQTNELIPLGRVLEFMIQGLSQQAAIGKTQRLYLNIKSDIARSRKLTSRDVPHIADWPDGYRHLSYDSFQKRFGHFKCVLPYVHIYFRNRDYNAWADILPEEQNPVVLPHDFSEWNATFWKQLESSRRIRLRAPNEKITISFQ